MSIKTRGRAAVAVAIAVGLVAFGNPAQAATASQLIVIPNPITVSLPGSTAGTAQLDSNCSPALDGGLNYGVIATTANSETATVVIENAAVDCSVPIHFTVTAVGCGVTTATFTPVAYNRNGKVVPGANKKLVGAAVPVTVTGSTCPTGGSVPPPAGSNPAAPAVANQYINEQAATAAVPLACGSAYKKAGKLWRGALIKDVAAWMPRPESVKDNPSLFPGNAWVDFVVSEVDSLCSGNGNVDLPAGLVGLTH